MQIKAVHQFYPAGAADDTVMARMRFLQRLLRELGFESDIFCETIEHALLPQVRPLHELRLRDDHLLLVHQDLDDAHGGWLQEVVTPMVLVYHRIDPEHAALERDALERRRMQTRLQLWQRRAWFLGAIGMSDEAADELRQAEFPRVATLPVAVDAERARSAEQDAAIVEALRPSFNLVCAGPVGERGRQLALIDILQALRRLTDQPVRLILIGDPGDAVYRARIEAHAASLGLAQHVILAGSVPDAARIACYRSAGAFITLDTRSDAAGLLEQMSFDMPLLAPASDGNRALLGEGGLLLEDLRAETVAGLLSLLLTEPAFRRRVVAGQRRSLARYADADTLRIRLADCLAQFGVASDGITGAAKVPAPARQAGPYWQIEGPFDSTYSLAIVNRELARALSGQGLDVGLRSMEGHGDFPPSPSFLEANPDCAALAGRAAQGAGSPDVSLRFCYPPHVDNMRGNVRLIHSYGWEESGFPKDYVDAFNRKLDMVTVLSHAVEKILRDNGVRIPIAVTGGGVGNLLDVAPQTMPEIADAAQKRFRFLHVSSCFPRKGVKAMLAAYGKAFRAGDDVSLVIKTFPNPHNDVAQQLAALRRTDKDYPHVVLIDRDCSQEELVGLYRTCDALVAPSHGEGFGLPLAEAMLFGLPVIATAWGGQRDFCDDATAWLCDYRFAKAQTHLGTVHSVWAEPDIDHLASLLREVHALPEESRAARTGLARERILRDYTWDRVAERTRAAVAALERQPLFRKEPKIGWISTWNKRCGIAAYSSFLTVVIPPERLAVFADRTDDRTAADGDTVTRCWNQHHEESMADVWQAISAEGIEVLVIQHNFGFFPMASLAWLIEQAVQAGIGVHCFFHATADLVRDGQVISLAPVAPALAKANRLYVHGIQDLNRLKDYGLVDNVVLFPQGVLATPPDTGESARAALGLSGKKIVASYGFLLPGKGMPQLIDAFAVLADDDPAWHLLLVNSRYPAPESEAEEAACRALIGQHGLDERVTLITDFLPDADSLAKLQMADLIVYPYQQTRESSSAAVRMGLAAGRPVAVTPLSIFEDVADAVHFLPGTDSAALADGIRRLLDSGEPAELLRRAESWTAPRQWPALSTRLLNIIDGIANPI